MTRFLSEALLAREPSFRQALRRMEAAAGHQSADIRLSTHVHQGAREKLRSLGLDPDDTTPQELYRFLQERLRTDDARLTRVLRTMAATHVSAEAEVVSGMVHALKALPDSKRCFALKNSTLRALLRKSPPKKAMKRLGYRSLDSFLKHEAPVSVLAAAYMSEGVPWQRRFLEQYKRLGPGDFETRDINIIRPDSPKWRELAAEGVARRRHNMLSFKEAGALVLLPLPEDAPEGAVTASLALALHELNRVRAAGTFLKMCQVRADFGSLVYMVSGDEPSLAVRLLDQPVSWQLLQRHYMDFTQHFREEIFGPHMRQEDLAWHSVERSLQDIDPGMSFWQGSAHLGLVHNRRPVSLNVVDAALNLCNGLPFERRLTQYFRQSLWHELLLKYLGPDELERSVMNMLQPELAVETVDGPSAELAEETVPAERVV